MLERGDLFAGRYQIVSLVGQGGYARVFRAFQPDVERDVAIKLLHPERIVAESGASAEVALKRFIQEAKLASKLRHPVNVTLHDFGQTEDGDFYMVMEFIDGVTLAETLPQGPFTPSRALKVITQLLEGLKEVHAVGALHRDIKPANIMLYEHLGERDKVKLLDFGMAKLADGGSVGLTQVGKTVGTVRYMSPEQLRGEELTPASDIYSLGLVAYELLVGRPPIVSRELVDVMKAIMLPTSSIIPPLDGLPDPIRAILDGMLEKNLERRYTSAKTVAKILARAIEKHRHTIGGSGLDSDTRTAPAFVPGQPRKKRSDLYVDDEDDSATIDTGRRGNSSTVPVMRTRPVGDGTTGGPGERRKSSQWRAEATDQVRANAPLARPEVPDSEHDDEASGALDEEESAGPTVALTEEQIEEAHKVLAARTLSPPALNQGPDTLPDTKPYVPGSDAGRRGRNPRSRPRGPRRPAGPARIPSRGFQDDQDDEDDDFDDDWLSRNWLWLLVAGIMFLSIGCGLIVIAGVLV